MESYQNVFMLFLSTIDFENIFNKIFFNIIFIYFSNAIEKKGQDTILYLPTINNIYKYLKCHLWQ